MSDEEHDGEEFEAIDIAELRPSPIYNLEGDAVEESKLVGSWLEAAKEEGSLNEDEQVTTKNMVAVVKGAVRKGLTGDMNEQEALALFGWWWGFSAGVEFWMQRQ